MLVHCLEEQYKQISKLGASSRDLADLDHQIGEVWEKRLYRLDRALQHYQNAFKTDPQHRVSIEAGRRIYNLVGRWEGVASLLVVELNLCTEPMQKADLLYRLGQIRHTRLDDMQGAAQALTEASHLAPGDERVQKALGDLYASPGCPLPDSLPKAAAIFIRSAQRQESQGNTEEAVSSLKRALGADPANEDANIRLESIYKQTNNWEELDKLYQQRLMVACDKESAELQILRAKLLEDHLDNPTEARECYEAALVLEGPDGKAAERLIELYRGQDDDLRMANLLQQMIHATADPQQRIALQEELAYLCRDRLEELEDAAHLFHEILQIQPQHEPAQQAYKEYFRHKGDYRNLAELVRYIAQDASERNAPVLEICAHLEELAEICERRLGDLDAAVEAWQQIALLHPDIERSRDALNRLSAHMQRWHQMVEALEQEAAQAVTPSQRLQALRRTAKAYAEWQVDPRRTMKVLRKILEQSPADEHALRMLVDICERDTDYEGLASALTDQLEGIMLREERVSVLRRLGDLYADNLNRPDDALKAFRALLDLAPQEQKVQARVLDILEQIEDYEQLAQVLEYRCQVAEDHGEQHEDLKRLAILAEQRLHDPERAISCWEQVRDQHQSDPETLEALARLYGQRGRYPNQLDALKQQLRLLGQAPRADRAAVLRQIAEVTEQRLNLPQEALKANEELSTLYPGERRPLESLNRLYSQLGMHEQQVEILRQQMNQSEDPEERVALAFKVGDVLEEQLGRLDQARSVFSQIITEMSPDDLDAHERLRRLYLQAGDFSKACEVAERELFLIPAQDDERLALSLEIADSWMNKADDPQRAVIAYERVLDLSPDNHEALSALRGLYPRIGLYRSLVNSAQTIFATLDDPQDRLAFIIEIAEINEERLKDPEGAFRWYQRACDLYAGEDSIISHLQRLAQEHNLWDDLIGVLWSLRKKTDDEQRALEITLQIADLQENEMDDAAAAFMELQQGLRLDPGGEQVLPLLERLAEAAQMHDALLEIYDRVSSTSAMDQQKRDVLARRARLAETTLEDPQEALHSNIRLFKLDPDDEIALQEIERLAQLSGNWEDVIRIHEFRLERSGEDEEQQVQILRHMAALLEKAMDSPGRAFRTHLRAFALCNDEAATVEHLWRLVPLISSDVDGSIHIDFTDPEMEAPPEEEEKGTTNEVDLEDIFSEEEASLPGDETTVDLEDPVHDLDDSQILGIGATTDELELHDAGGELPTSHLGGPQTSFNAWEELAQAYLLRRSPDKEARVRDLLEVAHIWCDGAGDVDRTLEALTEAATIDVEHPEVEEQLWRLATDHDHWDVLLQIYDDALDRCTDGESMVRLRLKVAKLLGEQNRPDEVVQHLLALLEIQPEHEEGIATLEKAYQDTERWEDLTKFQEGRLEARVDELELEELVIRLVELADLHQHRLDNPERAEHFLTQLDEVSPGDQDVLQRIAQIHEQGGAWPELVQVLERMAQEIPDHGDRISHLHHLARIHEQELDLPEKAVEVLQRVLEQAPQDEQALTALSRLYAAQGQIQALMENLQQRIEAAGDDPQARQALLMELALANEQQGDLDAAVDFLQQARIPGQQHPELEQALARVLIAGSRPDEAVDLFQSQISDAKEREAPQEEVAALLVQLAQVQDQYLSHTEEARQTLDQARELQPRGPEVLQALAQFLLRNEAWSEYVEVLEQLIEVAPEDLDPVASLMAAGNIMEEQEQDPERASQLFERALQISPGHQPALDALLCLRVISTGRREELMRLDAELEQDPQAEALKLIALGKFLQEQDAAYEAVAPILEQALELSPDFLPALEARAELMMRHEMLDSARAMLEDALGRLAGSNETGAINYRLGRIYEELQRGDDAYTFLLEAQRRDPEDRVLCIALGLNRYRAERWGEAFRHLEPVLGDEVPGASKELLQEAQYAAGVCALQLKRRQQAVPFFEAVLELNPEHLSALGALSGVALDQEDWQEAARLLQRELEVTQDGGRRITLLRALADLHLQHLTDPAKAAHYFEELYLSGRPDDEAHTLQVLPAMLPVLRETGRHETAAQVAEDLARILEEPVQRRELLFTAAEEREAAGQTNEAEAIYQDLLKLDPACTRAVEMTCRLLSAAERHDEVVELVSRFLAEEAPPLDGSGSPQHARIYRYLGMAQATLEDPDAAAMNLERSLELDDQLEVRESLVEIYGDAPEFAVAALENHRRLLQSDIGQVLSLRHLALAMVEEDPFRAHCLYQVLQAQGQLDEEGAAFLEQARAPAIDMEAHYPGKITAEDREDAIYLPEVWALHEIFEALAPQVHAILPVCVESARISAASKVSPMDDSPVAHVLGATTRALGCKNTALHFGAVEDRLTVFRVVPAKPPAVVIPAGWSEESTVDELRFVLGRAMELSHPFTILAAGLEPDHFTRLMSLVLRAFHPRHMRSRDDLTLEEREEVSVFRRALPFKLARRLGELFRQEASTPFHSARWRAAVLLSANRVGLILCGNLDAALRVLRREDPSLQDTPTEDLVSSSPAIKDLLTFASSDTYHACRIKLLEPTG